MVCFCHNDFLWIGKVVTLFPTPPLRLLFPQHAAFWTRLGMFQIGRQPSLKHPKANGPDTNQRRTHRDSA